MSINLEELFDRYSDEYLKFERVENKMHSRQDICAFLILAGLTNEAGRNIIVASDRDKIWIDVSPDIVAEMAAEEDIITLIRCGVRFDESNDCFYIYV